jgi:hypothetical protein
MGFASVHEGFGLECQPIPQPLRLSLPLRGPCSTPKRFTMIAVIGGTLHPNPVLMVFSKTYENGDTKSDDHQG